ncbi:thiol reductant ABC exporter subunit CydD [Ciceribacter azotifigens]|uniref:thiol reductant ABC exporter subunit CydD n=1 Tax=Ciceribacter azotifigens TaxID=2069303 RepID=UPI003A8960B4
MSRTEKIKSDPARGRLMQMARRDSGAMATASSLSVLAALLWLPQAWLVSQFLAPLVEGRTPGLGPVVTTGAFIALGLMRHLLDALAGRRAFGIGQRLIERERIDLVERESLASPLAGSSQTSAALATLLAGKLDALLPWASRYRLAAVKVATVPAVILVVTASMSWLAGVVLLVAGPLIPVFMALIGIAARQASEKQMAATGTLNSTLLEWLNAASDIRLLNAEALTVERFRQSAETLRAKTMGVLRIAFLSSTVLELFSAIGIALVAVYVGFALLGTFTFGAYETPLTVAEGILILLLAPDFFQPLRDLAAAWHDKAAALAVAGELAEREINPRPRILGRGARADSRLAGALTIATRGLRYEAGGREIAFPDIEIMPGEKVAICGPSGAGKTTFIGLLCGLARPSSGRVEIGGHLLDDDLADAWRGMTGFVGQHPHMLNASLRANVALAGDRIDRDRFDAALADAAADGVVAALARGADTRLGENGSGVSGGEARRLTIARAVYADAKVIFADEPTADLDTATAGRIAEALENIGRQGATLVIATHDPRLIARFDRVITLEAGR